MLIRSNHFKEDHRNHDWTPEQMAEGSRLESLVNANLNDEAAMEKAVRAAGFTQDSLGQFFITKGTVTNIDRLTGEKSTAANVILVPTPVALTAGLGRPAQRQQA